MSNVLISIISKHTLPNYLFFKEFEEEYDILCIISTPETKKQFNYFVSTIGNTNKKIKHIEVVNDNYVSIIESLESECFFNEDKYCINQTGGTKIMSIALFQFFQKYDSKFIYITNGRNEYIDMISGDRYSISYRLSLSEYLSLYGMSYQSNHIDKQRDMTPTDIFNDIRNKSFWISPEYRNPQCYFPPDDWNYYMGAWFEEYSYNRIKRELSLDDNQIALSAKIFREDSLTNDNELDVIFVKDNKLNIIECKVSMIGYGKDAKDVVYDYLYKLAAIAKDMGLSVNSYLCTLHKMGKFSVETLKHINKRCEILGINKIIDSSDFKHPQLPFYGETSNNIAKDNTNVNIFKLKKPTIKLNIVGKIDLDKISKK